MNSIGYSFNYLVHTIASVVSTSEILNLGEILNPTSSDIKSYKNSCLALPNLYMDFQHIKGFF